MNIRVLFAVCFLLSSVPKGYSGTAPELLNLLAANLEGITGRSVELHASPVAFNDQSLSLICEALTAAFREVATDPQMKMRLDTIVRSVVIDEFYGGGEAQHVALDRETLTVQSLNNEEAARALEPLIVQILKTVALGKAPKSP